VLLSEAYQLSESEGGGRVSWEGLEFFLDAAGDTVRAEKWTDDARRYCKGRDLNAAHGISQELFVQLMNGNPHDYVYWTDDDLVEMVTAARWRAVADERRATGQDGGEQFSSDSEVPLTEEDLIQCPWLVPMDGAKPDPWRDETFSANKKTTRRIRCSCRRGRDLCQGYAHQASEVGEGDGPDSASNPLCGPCMRRIGTDMCGCCCDGCMSEDPPLTYWGEDQGQTLGDENQSAARRLGDFRRHQLTQRPYHRAGGATAAEVAAGAASSTIGPPSIGKL